MTARKPERPKLTAHRESIVPGTPDATPVDQPTPEPVAAPATATLSLRLPAELVERFQRQIRILHAETGQQKGVISAELLEEALTHVEEITARLSAR